MNVKVTRRGQINEKRLRREGDIFLIHQFKCGAEYDLVEIHSSQRDKDSIECSFCGAELIHWNGGCFWLSKLITPPRNSEEKMGQK